MAAAVEIPYAEFKAMEPDLQQGQIGDGQDGKGRPFWMRRYTSRTTGKIYDCVFVSGLDREPRCAEIPGPSPAPD